MGKEVYGKFISKKRRKLILGYVGVYGKVIIELLYVSMM